MLKSVFYYINKFYFFLIIVLSIDRNFTQVFFFFVLINTSLFAIFNGVSKFLRLSLFLISFFVNITFFSIWGIKLNIFCNIALTFFFFFDTVSVKLNSCNKILRLFTLDLILLCFKGLRCLKSMFLIFKNASLILLDLPASLNFGFSHFKYFFFFPFKMKVCFYIFI